MNTDKPAELKTFQGDNGYLFNFEAIKTDALNNAYVTVSGWCFSQDGTAPSQLRIRSGFHCWTADSVKRSDGQDEATDTNAAERPFLTPFSFTISIPTDRKYPDLILEALDAIEGTWKRVIPLNLELSSEEAHQADAQPAQTDQHASSPDFQINELLRAAIDEMTGVVAAIVDQQFKAKASELQQELRPLLDEMRRRNEEKIAQTRGELQQLISNRQSGGLKAVDDKIQRISKHLSDSIYDLYDAMKENLNSVVYQEDMEHISQRLEQRITDIETTLAQFSR